MRERLLQYGACREGIVGPCGEDRKAAQRIGPQLFINDERRIWLRVHDLRASFVTVALANGKSESLVADRTGHMSSAIINRYKRWARSHEELNLGDCLPLHEAIPEFRDAEEGR